MGYQYLIFGIFDLMDLSAGVGCTDFGSFSGAYGEIGMKLMILIGLFMRSIGVSTGRLMAS